MLAVPIMHDFERNALLLMHAAAGKGDNRDASHILRWLLQGSVTTTTAGNHDHGGGDGSAGKSMRHQMTPEMFFQRNWEKRPVHIRGEQ